MGKQEPRNALTDGQYEAVDWDGHGWRLGDAEMDIYFDLPSRDACDRLIRILELAKSFMPAERTGAISE